MNRKKQIKAEIKLEKTVRLIFEKEKTKYGSKTQPRLH